jgi:addiction module RelE/StbE family toxin
MRIIYSRHFIKRFKARIKPNPKLVKQYEKRLRMFMKDPQSKQLRDHKLVGSLKNARAFSVTGDVRVIYRRENKGTVVFVNIGTHNQVYSP